MSSLNDVGAEQIALLRRVDRCSEYTDTTAWEDDFLESIREQLVDGRELTAKQTATLERIEYKVAFGVTAYWEGYAE